MNMLIALGGEVKSLGNGRVEGFLVRFSDESTPDQSGYRDFFTAETDYGVEWETESGIKTAPVYFHHGLDEQVKKRRLGSGTLKMTDTGIWIEAKLKERDEWEQAVGKLVGLKKAGWSSGAASHLVEREAVKDASGATIAHRVLCWPIAEASLTHTPADPGNDAYAIKSLEEAAKGYLVKMGDSGGYGSTDPFEGIEESAACDAIRQTFDRLMWGPVMAAIHDERPVSERIDALRPLFDRQRDLSLSFFAALLGTEAPDVAAKALKAALALTGREGEPPTLADHLAAVASTNASLASRLESRFEARARDALKAGRMLSQANVEELQAVIDAIDAMMPVKERLMALMERAQPKPSSDDAQKTADRLATERLRTDFLRGQSRVSVGVAA